MITPAAKSPPPSVTLVLASRTVVVFLSEPSAYSGGRFEVCQPPPEPATRTLETPANSAVVFSAQHVAHRVTRVERGCRRSLVAWATERDVSQQYEPCTHFDEVRRCALGVLEPVDP